MTFNRFHNALRIMLSIDRVELADGGIRLSDEEWHAFRSDPYFWFIRAGDNAARSLWAIIEARQTPRDI